MSVTNVPTRTEGKVEEIGGTIEKKMGHLFSNEEMELEGRLKELKGKAHQSAAKDAERVKGLAEEASGIVKSRLGTITDDEQLKIEGRLLELKGNARQAVNQ